MLAGSPIMTLRRTAVGRILISITLLPLGLLFAFLAGLAFFAAKPEAIAGAVFGALGVAFLAWYAWLFRREATRRTILREDGIEQVVGGQALELRWGDISEIWFRAIKVQAGGLIGAAVSAGIDAATKSSQPLSEKSTNITVRFVGASSEIKLTSGDKGVLQALEEGLRRVNPGLVSSALRTVQDGQGARFGRVTISSRGVSFGRAEPVGFGDIESFTIKGGKLYLKKRGRWLAQRAVAIHKVPNVFALLEVFDKLNARTPTGPTLDKRLASTTVV